MRRTWEIGLLGNHRVKRRYGPLKVSTAQGSKDEVRKQADSFQIQFF